MKVLHHRGRSYHRPRCFFHAGCHPRLSALIGALTASTAGLSLAVLAFAAICPVGASELHWDKGPGYRSAALSIPKEGRNGFTRVAGSISGILFTNVLSQESGVRTQLRLAGS